MNSRVVPKWAALPQSAPASHTSAWERAWSQAPPGRSGAGQTSASTAERINKMLLSLVSDPEAPADLVAHALTAHVTEGRGAPDGIGPRGRLVLLSLRRDLWRASWIPASLTGLQESDREFPRDERIDLTRELLSRSRIPAELRPMVLAVSVLARPQQRVEEARQHLSRVLSSPDVDRACAARLFKLMRRPGWFVVRPEGWKHHGELDEGTRSSLRRSKAIHLPISAAVVLAVDDLRAADSTLPEDSAPLRKVAEGKGHKAWAQPRLPELDRG